MLRPRPPTSTTGPFTRATRAALTATAPRSRAEAARARGRRATAACSRPSGRCVRSADAAESVADRRRAVRRPRAGGGPSRLSRSSEGCGSAAPPAAEHRFDGAPRRARRSSSRSRSEDKRARVPAGLRPSRAPADRRRCSPVGARAPDERVALVLRRGERDRRARGRPRRAHASASARSRVRGASSRSGRGSRRQHRPHQFGRPSSRPASTSGPAGVRARQRDVVVERLPGGGHRAGAVAGDDLAPGERVAGEPRARPRSRPTRLMPSRSG